MALPRQANLGIFADFMQRYGQASQPTRSALYVDTSAYSAGRETAQTLYTQVYDLLGVAVPSPQPFGGLA